MTNGKIKYLDLNSLYQSLDKDSRNKFKLFQKACDFSTNFFCEMIVKHKVYGSLYMNMYMYYESITNVTAILVHVYIIGDFVNGFILIKVTGMLLPGAGANRTQIPPSNPKHEKIIFQIVSK